MNREALIRGIESALPLLNTPGGTEKLAILLYYAANDPTKSDPRLMTLVSLLRAEPELESFDGYMQVVAHSASRVEHGTLAGWLLRRAQAVGAPQAISDLERYLASDRLPCTYTFAITGIKLLGSCSFGSGIELVPWNSLPDSSTKHHIYERFIESMPTHLPTAALLRPVIVPKLHVREVDFKVHGFDLPYEELQDALLCSGLIGPVALYLLASWLEPPDWAPVHSGGYSWPFPEGFPRTSEWPSGACERACLLIGAFRTLNKTRKARLRLAMQRLNSAMRRLSQVDAAIDLGIVLEVLFLQDTSAERSELTFRLRVRAARYLKADPQERHRVFALLNDLYKVRSAAVHNGHVPEKIKGVPVQDLLNQGFGLAAAALGRLISSGDPDWDQVTLS
jgi:hypothetical protein